MREPLLVAFEARASTSSVSVAFLVVGREDGARWGRSWRFDDSGVRRSGILGSRRRMRNATPSRLLKLLLSRSPI